MEVDARLFPVALDRALRHTAKRRDLDEGKATEEFEVHYLRQRRIDFAELIQSFADLRQLFFVNHLLHGAGLKRRNLELFSALQGVAASNIIYDQPAHNP